MYYFDPSYIFVIIGALFAMGVQAWLKSTFNKYSRVGNVRGYTANQVAEMILRRNGVNDVGIGRISGSLTDNFNPRTGIVSLSDTVYGNTSIAAIGVAAHECGHAIQHHVGYAPIKLRNAIVPVVNIASKLSMPCIIVGLIFGSGYFNPIIQLGIILFSAAVIFQLVTLPVEIDASRRALKILREDGILYGDENSGAKKVLTAAAMTYVAALANSVIQLLRLIYLFGGRRRND